MWYLCISSRRRHTRWPRDWSSDVCSSDLPLRPVDSWEEHLARVAALETWYVSGQLGVRLPDNSGSARLRWQQTQDDFRIDLSGPFGQGRTQIQGRPGAVTLQQGGEEPLQASSAEELLWLAT